MKKIFYHYIYPLYIPIWILILTLSTIVIGPIVILILLIPHLDKGARFTYRYLALLWAWINLATSGVRVKVVGREKVDRKKSYIVMANHQSNFDVLALATRLPLQLRWVAKRELMKVPIFGFAIKKMGMIIIDRKDPEKAYESMRAADEKIKSGLSVIILPEGTRSRNGKLLEFKKGGFVMALQTKTPILPITINGSRFCLPKGGLFSLRPGKIQMIIHDIVDVAGLTIEDRDRLSAEVRKVIEAGLNLSYGRV
ncbi:MAG: 1-acyl-sn-glycerol-3-phosphate acyltransferase [Candidatus Dadabacteria bacterium]|nr:1-acyl-sn-glycerol-3-phosphate acyltransferase [Candidatus Dadabacteria bacterium]